MKPNSDILTEETIGQPDNLDPAIDYETAGGGIIQNVYENLLFFSGYNSSKVVPWLASNYTISPDGLTWTFKLRTGIKFSDGTAFNSSAVTFNLLRTVMIDDPNGPAWTIEQALRGAPAFAQGCAACTGTSYNQTAVNKFLAANPIETPDANTVVFHLDHPYSPLAFVTAFSSTSIVSPSAVIKHWTKPTNSSFGYITGITAGDYTDALNPWALSNMVGTGPYLLTSWDKSTQTIVLNVNPNFWGGPFNIKPYFKTVIIRGIDDANTRTLDCKAGTTDICAVPATGGYIFQLINQNTWFSSGKIANIYPGVAVTGPYSTFNIDFFGLNQKIHNADGTLAKFQPFADVRVRQAIALLFNQTQYIRNVLNGFGVAACQAVPPGMFGYDPTIKCPTYNQAMALQLLQAAGPSVGFSPSNPQTVTISYNTGNLARQTIATIMAASLNSISSQTGLKATVEELPWPQYLAKLHAKALSVFRLGWAPDYVDPDDYLVPFFGTGQTYTGRIGWSNSTINSWVLQQASMSDPVARAALISQINKAVNSQYIYVWTSFGVATDQYRNWIRELPNAPVGSNINGFNSAMYTFYYATIGLAQ